MSGWIDNWLAGGKAAAPRATEPEAEPGQYRGERLGLPEHGAGSVAGMGRRLAALVIDCVLAMAVTSLFVHPRLADQAAVETLNYWSLATWAVITVLATALFGITPGMAALGIRVARVDGASLLGPVRAVVRAVLVALVIPAVVWNIDNRGLQDRAVGTVVLRTR